MFVERVAPVGVGNNHEHTRVSVDHLSLVASLQISEDRGIINCGLINTVFARLKLVGVDLANFTPLWVSFP